MNPTISKPDLKKIVAKLQIKKNDPATALKNIMSINNHSNLGELFFKYFFVPNDEITFQEAKLLESLSDGCQFKIIHANSKNGKTTFINQLEYKLLERYGKQNGLIFIKYDFEKSSGSSFFHKVQMYFINSFVKSGNDDQKSINLNLSTFNTFIINFQEELSKEGYDAPSNFIKVNLFPIIFVLRHHILNNGNFSKVDYLDRYDYFQKIIERELNIKNCGSYFLYIILFDIYKSKNEFNKAKSRVIIALDNIDDYLVNNDISFLQHPQILISTFFFMISHPPVISHIFIKQLNNSTKSTEFKTDFSLRNQLSFIYVFRTANFYIFANLLKKIRAELPSPSEQFCSNLMINKEFYELSTLSFTPDVFMNRLNRYKEIAGLLKMDMPTGYQFLKELCDNFDSQEYSIEQMNVRRIYNIWNGDKFALWNLINTYWPSCENHYFANENILLTISTNVQRANTNITCNENPTIWYKYLLRGVYIHFFLFLLELNSDLEPLLEHTIYPYRDPSNGNFKSIERIILNYIINNSNRNNRPKKINEIQRKGLGFYDLLYEVEKFITAVNKKIKDPNSKYSFDSVEKYFNDLCELKIDHFAHLFVFYKDQIVIDENKASEYSNIYDLNKEIATFKEKGSASKAELNKIRLFHNDSASYISDSLLTSYELYSFTIKNESNIYDPLLFLIKRKEGIGIVEQESHFAFYEAINSVYNNVERTLNNMVDFYIESLVELFPPDNFPIEPIFSKLYITKDVNEVVTKTSGDFQFLLTISRHFTYIQYFRQLLLKYCSGIIDLSFNEKKIANTYLLNVLVKYLNLYITNFNKINADAPISRENKLFKVRDTYLKFLSVANNFLENNSFDLIS
jgi:hypothetical protein